MPVDAKFEAAVRLAIALKEQGVDVAEYREQHPEEYEADINELAQAIEEEDANPTADIEVEPELEEDE